MHGACAWGTIWAPGAHAPRDRDGHQYELRIEKMLADHPCQQNRGSPNKLLYFYIDFAHPIRYTSYIILSYIRVSRNNIDRLLMPRERRTKHTASMIAGFGPTLPPALDYDDGISGAVRSPPSLLCLEIRTKKIALVTS